MSFGEGGLQYIHLKSSQLALKWCDLLIIPDMYHETKCMIKSENTECDENILNI